MRRYFFGVAASLLAVVGLAGSPSPARADHHDWHHHHGWHDGHHHWDRNWYGSQRYAPYRPQFFVQPYGYSYPNYVPYYNYNYVYPSYGFGYQGPYFSFSVGP